MGKQYESHLLYNASLSDVPKGNLSEPIKIIQHFMGSILGILRYSAAHNGLLPRQLTDKDKIKYDSNPVHHKTLIYPSWR